MPHLYFDESGYSGGNLLDTQTPYYSCAALNVTEQHAQQLKAKHFPGKTTELKFSGMEKGRNFHASKDLITELLDAHAVRVTVVDKRFALTGKIFECIAEPAMSDRKNVYVTGELPKLVNEFHLKAQAEQSSELQTVHKAFQAMMLHPEPDKVAALVAALQTLTGRPREIADRLLLPPLTGDVQALVGPLDLTEGFLGILLTAAWQNLLRWGAVIPVGTPIDVVYDQHSVLEAEMELWDAFTSAPLDMRANGFSYVLNHPVTTRLGVSDNETALQLADLVAGFASFAVASAAANPPDPTPKQQNGLRAYELLHDPAYVADQVLLTVEAGGPERFTGWTVQ